MARSAPGIDWCDAGGRAVRIRNAAVPNRMRIPPRHAFLDRCVRMDMRHELLGDALCRRPPLIPQIVGRHVEVRGAVGRRWIRHPTHTRPGSATSRQVERSGLVQQSNLCATARHLNRESRTGGQGELFGPEALAKPYLNELRKRYCQRAESQLLAQLKGRDPVPFEQLALLGMQHPTVSEQDVRDWVVTRVKLGEAELTGLRGKQRTPRWGEGHGVKLVRAAPTS
jgi:hypothetical protein